MEVVDYDDINTKPLFEKLRLWRNNLADEMGIPPYGVLKQKTLYQLANSLPSSFTELRLIKGIGNAKIKQFGDDILEIINVYRKENGLKVEVQNQLEIITPKKEKVDTKLLSFELYKQGKTIDEIAQIRQFSVSTIEGHLAHFVGEGLLLVSQFITNEKLEIITEFFIENKTKSINLAKSNLGESVSYSDLKFVLKHLEFEAKVN